MFNYAGLQLITLQPLKMEESAKGDFKVNPKLMLNSVN